MVLSGDAFQMLTTEIIVGKINLLVKFLSVFLHF